MALFPGEGLTTARFRFVKGKKGAGALFPHRAVQPSDFALLWEFPPLWSWGLLKAGLAGAVRSGCSLPPASYLNVSCSIQALVPRELQARLATSEARDRLLKKSWCRI